MSDLSILKNKIHHPNDMPYFKASISKKKFNNCVQFFEETYEKSFEEVFEDDPSIKCDANSKRGRKAVSTKNTVQPFMCHYWNLVDIPIEIMNVLEGVARLDWYSRGDDLRKNVVAPDPVIEHSFISPWTRVLIKCDANSDWKVKEDFTKRKPNLYGEYFLSPAGVTRKEYLNNLCELDNNSDQLSVSKMVMILQSVKDISTKNIQSRLSFGKRQAERYNKACKIALPFVEDAFKKCFENKAKTFRKKYKAACEKDNIPWTMEDEELSLQGQFDTMAVDACGGGLSEYYHEEITGVYKPFEGISLKHYSTKYSVPYDEFIIGNTLDKIFEEFVESGDLQDY